MPCDPRGFSLFKEPPSRRRISRYHFSARSPVLAGLGRCFANDWRINGVLVLRVGQTFKVFREADTKFDEANNDRPNVTHQFTSVQTRLCMER